MSYQRGRMKILSINKAITHDTLSITDIKESELSTHSDIQGYDYIIINGGDGTIRRVLKTLQNTTNLPPFILNPTGSFNVIAQINRVPKIHKVLETLSNKQIPNTRTQNIYALNKEIFLFSAGNMGDLQHIFLAETLRFGILKHGILKYILAVLFLLPLHLVMTPFMLLSPRRFFIFTPASFIGKVGSFYGKVESPITIDLENSYNLIELDGDVVTIEEDILKISAKSSVEIVI